MTKIRVGLVSAPNLPAYIAEDLCEELPDYFSEEIDKETSWEVETTVDTLVGVAEETKEVLDKANNIKKEQNWEYVICLTDLPIFFKKKVVVGNASLEQKIGQVSIPAFGVMPMHKRIRVIIIELMKELYLNTSEQTSAEEHTLENGNDAAKNIGRQFLFSRVRRDNASPKSPLDFRYIVRSRVIGYLRILFGMTYANRPWQALLSFKKIVMLSFASGAYVSIFPNPWVLSVAYSPLRLGFLMLLSIFGMVIWIIFSHNLWEKPSEHGKKRWRDLYNHTTFLTLTSIVALNYLVLFTMFLAAMSLLVPPELFQVRTQVEGSPSFIYYIKLVWLVTSFSTLIGAIGTGLEKEERIRNATYSFRQQQRYYEIGDEENGEGNQDEGTKPEKRCSE
ncbi:hypothetical protein [Oceanobacillus manasiensis]|uniref:hypothetical protein n=1 Tax=Oceanobacillus manasiensis TaxID=586413 RepID=UPI0005A878A4|nr:hypothetical protein [Oceanobacillus manasiensis]